MQLAETLLLLFSEARYQNYNLIIYVMRLKGLRGCEQRPLAIGAVSH